MRSLLVKLIRSEDESAAQKKQPEVSEGTSERRSEPLVSPAVLRRAQLAASASGGATADAGGSGWC